MGCIGSKSESKQLSRHNDNTLTTNNNDQEEIKRYKVLVLGDANVGKSSLIVRYVEGKFPEKYINSLGDDDFLKKTLQIENQEIELSLWDTAGQERFRTITGSFYKNTHGTAICFDLSSRSSFERLNKWFEQVKLYGGPDLPTVLIGTKLDVDNREVTTDEAKAFAKNKSIPYIETSAKTNQDVDLAFQSLAKEIYTYQREKEESD